MKFILSFVLALATVPLCVGQIDEGRLIRMRDSLDNLLIVNPTSSAILVEKGQVEFYSFNSLLISNRFNDRDGQNSNIPGSQLYFSNISQLNFGLSKLRRFNAGIDVCFSAYRYSLDKEQTYTAVFDDGAVSALTYVGPRIRVQPFRNVRRFNIQVYSWIPVADAATQQALNTSRVVTGATFFYYKYILSKLAISLQANTSINIPGENSEESATPALNLPLSFAVSYAPSQKNIFFASGSYVRMNEDISTFMEGADSDYVMVGAGYQHIFFRTVFLNISYNTTLMARNYGTWSGLNAGIRVLL